MNLLEKRTKKSISITIENVSIILIYINIRYGKLENN